MQVIHGQLPALSMTLSAVPRLHQQRSQPPLPLLPLLHLLIRTMLARCYVLVMNSPPSLVPTPAALPLVHYQSMPSKFFCIYT
jgi:hypothetical protein